MDENDKAYELITEPGRVIPKLSKKTDGFSRQDVVNAFQRTFLMIGGVPRMALWANANPDKFYPLYARLMPSTAIQIGDNANVQIVHSLAPTALDQHPTGSYDTRESPPGGDPVEVGGRPPVGEVPRGQPLADGPEDGSGSVDG